MRKAFLSLSLLFFLVGCSSGLEGEWVVTNQDSAGCFKRISFQGGQKVSLEFEDGQSESGTYNHVKDDQYRLEIGSVSIPVEVTIKEDELSVKEEGDSYVCTYKQREQ